MSKAGLTVSLRVPEPFYSELKREGEAEGLNMTSVIRRLIIRHCRAKDTASRKSRVRVA